MSDLFINFAYSMIEMKIMRSIDDVDIVIKNARKYFNETEKEIEKAYSKNMAEYKKRVKEIISAEDSDEETEEDRIIDYYANKSEENNVFQRVQLNMQVVCMYSTYENVLKFIKDTFEHFGLDKYIAKSVHDKAFDRSQYPLINELRIVNNCIKHNDGKAIKELEINFPTKYKADDSIAINDSVIDSFFNDFSAVLEDVRKEVKKLYL